MGFYICTICLKLSPWDLPLQNVLVNLRTVVNVRTRGKEQARVVFCPNKGLLLKACPSFAYLWLSNYREEREALWEPSLYVIYSKPHWSHEVTAQYQEVCVLTSGSEFVSDCEIVGSWNPRNSLLLFVLLYKGKIT